MTPLLAQRCAELPEAARNAVLRRDQGACVCCGKGVIRRPWIPLRRDPDGGDSLPNLITVSEGCGERIASGFVRDDEARGYTLRDGQDPAEVPVMTFSRHGSGVTLWLTPDGGRTTEVPDGVAA